MENAQTSIEQRGRSMYGRVYKRRECTSCENCNHEATVDVLGENLAAVLTLKTAPVTAAPIAAVPVTAADDDKAAPKSDAPLAAFEPTVSRAAAKKEGKGKTGGKTAAAPRVRAPLARKASNKIDTEAGVPAADSVAPVKKVPVEKKDTETVRKSERKTTKPAAQAEKKKTVKNDKENCPRVSTRKVRSVMDL